MAERIFISYAFKDEKNVDVALRELQKRGIISEEENFLDPIAETASGFDLRESIKIRIEAASKIMILWTENSANSQYVNYEAGMAIALGKPIFVVIPEESNVEIPNYLADMQVFRLGKDG